MPDLSIPSNAFPIECSRGTPAVADTVLRKVANPDYWPEDVPHIREVQYPFLNLRAYDANPRTERVFSPFHRANLFDIRTIAWLISIGFISRDDLTEKDCFLVDIHKRRPEGRLTWHPDSEYSLTEEQRSAWVEKYRRRDAFFRRKQIHDDVRSKRQSLREKAYYEWKMLPESSRPPKPETDPYDYTRDVLGGRLREVRPNINPRRRRSPELGRNCKVFTAEEIHLLREETNKLYGVNPLPPLPRSKPRFIPFINRLNGKATGHAPRRLPLPPCAYMFRDDVPRMIGPLSIVHKDTAHDGASSKDANAICVQTPGCTGKGPTRELPAVSDSRTPLVAASILTHPKQSLDKGTDAPKVVEHAQVPKSGIEHVMQAINAKFPKTRLPLKKYRERHSEEEVLNWFFATANIDGIRRHGRNAALKGNKDAFLARKKEWVPLHSRLRQSVTVEGVASYAFNHKMSLDECGLGRMGRSPWDVHALRHQEVNMRKHDALGPLYHWLGKGKPCTLMSYVGGHQWDSFVGLRGSSVGRNVVKVRVPYRAYTRIAAGWTGQPVMIDGYH